MTRRILLSALAATAAMYGEREQTATTPATDPLGTLRREHPRLILSNAEVDRIRGLIKTDAFAASLHQSLVEDADKILKEPPVEYKLIGPRLLDKSRTCLTRVYTLALLWRLDKKQEYFDRAVQELRAVSRFPDWHPPHFLDTAEMTHAVAIGYDWLYPSLNSDDSRLLLQAIVTKGLNAALPIYQRSESWSKATHNWNQVCNGGIGLGALAIAEKEPQLAHTILNYSLSSIPLALASYAPDGGWAEGPGYWDYATAYTVYYLAGLQSALGTDFNLSRSPGFNRAGHFRLYFCGPTGTFNYADAHPDFGAAPEMFWLAQRFQQPIYKWHEKNMLSQNKQRPSPLHLIWFSPEAEDPVQARLPLNAAFQGVDVGFLRGSWSDKNRLDPNTIWVGAKGGDNHANHSHLDLGSFVFDAGGVRWAEDLGSDDYNIGDYFGQKRYTYYRLQTESHNTVLIDGANQDPNAKAKLRLVQPRTLEIDLTPANPGKTTHWTRRLRLRPDELTLFVEDEIEASQPIEAVWGMVTSAAITQTSGNGVSLKKSNSLLIAQIESPPSATFDIVPTQPPLPQNQNAGTRKLIVRLPEKITKAKIIVRLTLGLGSGSFA